jgi:hypothetical protein
LARERSWTSGRSTYALIALPFLVLAVVMFTGGNTGLAAAYVAIGVTFLALSKDDGEDDEDRQDDGEDPAAEDDTGTER